LREPGFIATTSDKLSSEETALFHLVVKTTANPTTNTRRSFLGKHTERPSNTGRLGHFPHPSWYQSRWEGCDAFCPQFRTDTWSLHPL